MAEEDAKMFREAEYAEMMGKYTVANDAEKKEAVMDTPTAPLITVTNDEGMTHSYPQRSFKPEQPKTTETVNLQAGSEVGAPVDHTMFACVSLAVMGSIALVSVGKSWLRSPVAAPEVNIELLSKSLDVENPIVDAGEPSWASSAVERALAAAEAK